MFCTGSEQEGEQPARQMTSSGRSLPPTAAQPLTDALDNGAGPGDESEHHLGCTLRCFGVCCRSARLNYCTTALHVETQNRHSLKLAEGDYPLHSSLIYPVPAVHTLFSTSGTAVMFCISLHRVRIGRTRPFPPCCPARSSVVRSTARSTAVQLFVGCCSGA